MAGYLASSASISALSPYSRNSMSGCRANAARGAGNDDRCADIATHGVKRDSNLLRHERPGNLISLQPCSSPAAR